MKKTTWFALICTAVYAVMQVVSRVIQLPEAETLRWYVTALSIGRAWLVPACVAVYILRGDKSKSLWMTAATALLVLENVKAVISSVRMLAVVSGSLSLWVMLMLLVLQLAATVVMLIGTFSEFRFASCLQVGAFAYVGVTLFWLLVSWVLAGGNAYFESVPADEVAVNVVTLCSIVATTLFYAGIGVLAVEKKREKQSVEPLS